MIITIVFYVFLKEEKKTEFSPIKKRTWKLLLNIAF